jgi:hypothetical protein
MVENMADDDDEPKPAIIEASGDVKPTINPFKLTLKKNLNRYLSVLPRFAVMK